MRVPVVFAFDDNYALPASIAIQSLLDSKRPSTEYEIIVFHGGLSPKTIQKMEKICPIRWVKVDKTKLNNAPCSEYWPHSVYYRLFIADLLPEYGKVIWSDVDVLFKGDLADIYAQDLQGADWGGIIAERQDETQGVHPHYPENKKTYIYMSGFMLIDTKLWRQKKMWDKFVEIIKTYGERLKFFDLDILNLAADKIYPVPFEYCVLENVYLSDDITKAKEYPWLSNTYSKETLLAARENPKILHFAGSNVKIWLREPEEIPDYYWDYIRDSPFYNKAYYYPSLSVYLKKAMWTVVAGLCPVREWRRLARKRRKRLACR